MMTNAWQVNAWRLAFRYHRFVWHVIWIPAVAIVLYGIALIGNRVNPAVLPGAAEILAPIMTALVALWWVLFLIWLPAAVRQHLDAAMQHLEQVVSMPADNVQYADYYTRLAQVYGEIARLETDDNLRKGWMARSRDAARHASEEFTIFLHRRNVLFTWPSNDAGDCE